MAVEPPVTSRPLPPRPETAPVRVPPLWLPPQVKVAEVLVGRLYTKDYPPQFTLTLCAPPPVLYAISAFDPSGFFQATFLTVAFAVESMRTAPGITNLVR